MNRSSFTVTSNSHSPGTSSSRSWCAMSRPPMRMNSRVADSERSAVVIPNRGRPTPLRSQYNLHCFCPVSTPLIASTPIAEAVSRDCPATAPTKTITQPSKRTTELAVARPVLIFMRPGLSAAHDLLDDLVRPRQQRRRDREPEGLGGLEVDDQFKVRGLFD